jgi:deazaflavin-dependent oxidoreductase (nitroreductase family)
MTTSHYRKPPWWLRYIGNRFSPRNAKLVARLSVPGRTSGQWRTTPVVVLHHDGERYLVAPGGQTEWARNLRAAGRGRLIRGDRVEEFVAEELQPRDRPPVLAAYLDRYGRMPTVTEGEGRLSRLPGSGGPSDVPSQSGQHRGRLASGR